ncbi:hypothetical protein L4C34_12745 [Vibrio profundum]|uniref:hypothetical protein n=1 Tax=Vibrio profundum TaxID=2910247 RepID=UPI003D0A2D2E
MKVNKNRHGYYTISCQHRLVLFAGFGSWNEETYQDLYVDIMKIVDQFGGEPWGFVGDTREWEVSTYQSIALWGEMQAHLVDRGLVCGAVVVDDSTFKTKVAEKNVEGELETKNFSVHEEAISWCQQVVKRCSTSST